MRRLHDIGRRGWPAILGMALTMVAPLFDDSVFTTLAIDRIVEDTRPGTGYLIFLSAVFVVLLVVNLYLLVCAIRDSAPGTNQYGPNPKGIGNVDVFD